MKTLKLITAAAAGLSLTSACANPVTAENGNNNNGDDNGEPKQKPNIILILMDDLGYSDLGCYGSEMNTPNIDRLAANGIRYRTFYNSARSAPTRASLITGLYPHQVGVGALGAIPGYANYQGYPNEKNNFIPETIKDAGYFSVMTGKWHLNHGKVMPLRRGFDRALSNTGGHYFRSDAKGQVKTNMYLNDEGIRFNDERLPDDWYSTDLWTDFGLKFIDEAVANDQPFFWYLANNAPHFPLQAPEAAIRKNVGKYAEGYDAIRNRRWERQKLLGLFSEEDELTPRNPHKNNKAWSDMTADEKRVADHRMAIYAACIEEADRNVGKILAYLEGKDILDNTVIIFLSDNGGNAESGFPGNYDGPNHGAAGSNVWLGTPWADIANTPYFLYKHHGHEGGCCTPFIISWPGGIDASLQGSIDKENVGHIIDIMPTVIELAGGTYPDIHDGIAVPKMEGVSLVPSVEGKKVKRSKPIIMEHEGNKMLRDGDWKIVKEYDTAATPWRLYDMRNDPTEMNDLAAEHPAKVNELEIKYNTMASHIGVEPGIEFTVGGWYVPVADYLQ